MEEKDSKKRKHLSLYYYDITWLNDYEAKESNDTGIVPAESFSVVMNKLEEDYGEDNILRVNVIDDLTSGMTHSYDIDELFDTLKTKGYITSHLS